ncbi:MAG: azoreductase [Pseudomonadota bacterium]|jgi:uncharacterized protein YbjT (DUF2867 family)
MAASRTAWLQPLPAPPRRATSRAPTAPDQAQLDLVTHQGLKHAFEGVDRAFLLAPPGHVNQHELLGPLIEQARAQGLDKLVLMSAMGAPLRRAGLQLEASGVPFNVIRPNWFMQNFHTFWLAGIRDAGTIFLPAGCAKGSVIDARDIAAVAAALLSSHAPIAFERYAEEHRAHGQVRGRHGRQQQNRRVPDAIGNPPTLPTRPPAARRRAAGAPAPRQAPRRRRDRPAHPLRVDGLHRLWVELPLRPSAA